MDVVEQMRIFVEDECKKPTNQYGYSAYCKHFVHVHRYAKMLAEDSDADLEIVELAAWLHDIGAIMFGRGNHHVTGCEIAENKLREIGYCDEDKIGRIKHCIFAHRGSRNIKRESVEAQILADADVMSHFDEIDGLFEAAYVHEGLDEVEGAMSVKRKWINSWNKLSENSKEIVRDKFEAGMLLMGRIELDGS